MGRPKGSVVLYQEIAKHLSAKIKKGTWGEGGILPSYSELAKMYDTADRTIRRALASIEQDGKIAHTANGKWIVRAKNRALDLNANRVVLVSTQQVSVVSSVHRGIKAALSQKEWQLHMICRYLYNRYTLPNKIIHGLRDADIHGVLLDGTFSRPCQREYADSGVPVVLVDAPPATDRIACISVANEAAAFDALQRLYFLGHRKIAFYNRVNITMRDIDPDSRERQRGFLNGLKQCDISNGQEAIFNFLGTTKKSFDQSAFKKLFTARPRFTAVLAVDAVIANDISNAALSAGLILPRDLAIAAFGDADSLWSGPRSDFERIGRDAVELLASKDIRQIRVPTTWYEGHSLGDPLHS